jgi:hypothetical protein
MRVVGFILVLLIALVSPVCATVYYVDGDMTDDTGAGTSWGTAKKTIQAAINTASNGDEVWVKALSSGYYNEHVTLVEGISLYGGFDTTESVRDRAKFICVRARVRAQRIPLPWRPQNPGCRL